ncbi:hypothetical protein [Nocardiopsis tropica]|uniref:Uncharacterized protein n=1 Tax=Nocardiopsis tropica TaxID=109330 RepID=A0ABU7KQZ2_9ACTN|nr:hypothetical protein [Nocardiopsis umidischolae]MEE2051715.1 hypothetical protein [Nocardiopsis umidischolae]
MTYHLMCRLCQSEMDSGVVCPTCVGGMMADLRALWATGDLHGLDVDLDIAIAKQSRFGGGGGGRGGGDEIPMLIDDKASDVRRYLHSMLSTWCRVILNQCGGTPPEDTIPAMAQWLHGQGVIIRSAEWGDECVQQIRYVVREVRRCVDRPAERIFAGECPTCAGKVFGIAGADRARCRAEGCDGEIEDPEARRDAAVKEAVKAAPDRLVTAAEASMASRALGRQITDRYVRKLAAEGKIHAVPGSKPARFPLGEIMDFLDRKKVAAA